MFDADAIEAIVDLARDSSIVTEHSATHLRVVDRHGNVRFEPTPPKPRKYEASSFSGFLDGVKQVCMVHERPAAADSDGGTPDLSPIFGDAAIFVGPREVRLVFSEADRRESLTLALNTTNGYRVLAEGKLRGLNQQAMIRTLKQLYDDRVQPASLIPDIKALRFKASTEGQSVVSAGKESIGNDIKRELAGMASDLPEEVVLGVKVFTDPSEQLDMFDEVRCHLTVDLDTQTFTLTPIDGQVEGAMDNALDRIASALANAELDEHIRVVHGVTVTQ